MNQKEILAQVEAELFDFDAARDVEDNSSDAPDYRDVEGEGLGFTAKAQAETDSVMTEEGWRNNVKAKITQADNRFIAMANRIKELEGAIRSLNSKLSVVSEHLGLREGKF